VGGKLLEGQLRRRPAAAIGPERIYNIEIWNIMLDSIVGTLNNAAGDELEQKRRCEGLGNACQSKSCLRVYLLRAIQAGEAPIPLPDNGITGNHRERYS
jgi:hypothetical protein